MGIISIFSCCFVFVRSQVATINYGRRLMQSAVYLQRANRRAQADAQINFHFALARIVSSVVTTYRRTAQPSTQRTKTVEWPKRCKMKSTLCIGPAAAKASISKFCSVCVLSSVQVVVGGRCRRRYFKSDQSVSQVRRVR